MVAPRLAMVVGNMSMVVKLLFFSCCGWIGELMITLYTVLV